jgi:hypothetical protein
MAARPCSALFCYVIVTDTVFLYHCVLHVSRQPIPKLTFFSFIMNTLLFPEKFEIVCRIFCITEL